MYARVCVYCIGTLYMFSKWISNLRAPPFRTGSGVRECNKKNTADKFEGMKLRFSHVRIVLLLYIHTVSVYI